MKVSEFFNVAQVQEFMSVNKFEFAGVIKAVDQDVLYIYMHALVGALGLRREPLEGGFQHFCV